MQNISRTEWNAIKLMKHMDVHFAVNKRVDLHRDNFSGADNSLIEKSWGLTVPKQRLDQPFYRPASYITRISRGSIFKIIVKMSQNGEDTVMEDAQGSQAGETEVGDEVPLEKKLFLVCMRATPASLSF